MQADVHLGVLDGSVSAGQKDQLDSLGGPHGLIGQDGLNGPDSLEQAVEVLTNVICWLNKNKLAVYFIYVLKKSVIHSKTKKYIFFHVPSPALGILLR